MIVRCPSNGRSASSTSGLLAPASQTSAGRASCSCLPWPAVLPRRPHRPYYSHRWPGHPSTHHTPCYSAATAASHHSEPVNPRTPLRMGIHCRVFPGSASSPSWPRRRPPPWCSRRGWSTWSRNDFRKTWTVREEADNWVHGHNKEVAPYYVENNYSST